MKYTVRYQVAANEMKEMTVRADSAKGAWSIASAHGVVVGIDECDDDDAAWYSGISVEQLLSGINRKRMWA